MQKLAQTCNEVSGTKVPAALPMKRKRGLKRPRSKRTSGTNEDTASSRRRQRKVSSASSSHEPDEAHYAVPDVPAIVISLERRPDRMEECAQKLMKNCAGMQYQRFVATDGKVTPIPESEVVYSWNTAKNVVYQKLRAIRKGWDDLDSYQERQLVLSPGERGCASSHIRAWRHCIEQSGGEERPLLVLEDDADPTPEFVKVFSRAWAALPSDANLLYLGYSQAAEWRREVSAELVESEYVWTTVGYVIWPACARILLSKLPVDQPVDNWMATLCAEGDVKAYCVRPKVIRQADAWNVNSDVAHSDEHYWGANSDIQHSDAFYWGNPGEEAKSKDGMPMVGGSCFWNIGSDESEDSTDEL
jgi:GR25 family glycosyltransferase involved in LPS biosynthesis